MGKKRKVTLLDFAFTDKEPRPIPRIPYYWMTDEELQSIHKFPYTGSYELEFLKFLDLIMDFDPEDIMAPSPHTYYYEYEGKKRFYIPDFFITSLKLEIEIKDGGTNPNTHPKIQAVDKVKEKLKDQVMLTNKSSFNYLKIYDKDHKKFLRYLDEAKKQFETGVEKPICML